MYLRSPNRRVRASLVRYPYALGDSLGPPTVGVPFDASTEAWRPLITKYAGELPVNFLLAWIRRESDGDPCSYTSLRESGIFQLEPPDNTNTAGTTEGSLRPACSGQQLTRPFTDDEKYEQVRSGIKYVLAMRNAARTKLASAGVTWPETSPDFWSVVKLQHAYPAPTSTWLNNALVQNGHPATSWQEMRDANPDARQDVLDNAEWVGAYGAGGGSSTSTAAVLALGALGVLGYLIYRQA